MKKRIIPFSPPDITRAERIAVNRVLKSGWITTGLKTKAFESELARFNRVETCIASSSATAGLELILRALGIGEGDEVITTPYTFSASASVILHTGAKLVFADVMKNGYHISAEEIEKKITKNTKAVIAVDFAGYPCDYVGILSVLEEKKSLFSPRTGTSTENFNRAILISDAAHALGAQYCGKTIPETSDFTVFSFHAVKNLTTAEGGALLFRKKDADLERKIRLLLLHGQSKSAHEKLKGRSYRYDIEVPGFKANMTDISAALGLAQMKRYDQILKKRKNLFDSYVSNLKEGERVILPSFSEKEKQNAFHLFPVRIKGFGEKARDNLILRLRSHGVSSNVHYVPLPMMTAYRNLGFKMEDFPNSFSAYENEITLPLFSKMKMRDADYVSDILKVEI